MLPGPLPGGRRIPSDGVAPFLIMYARRPFLVLFSFRVFAAPLFLVPPIRRSVSRQLPLLRVPLYFGHLC